MLKICWRISDTDMQNSHSLVHSSYSLPDVSAGRIARQQWWTGQELCPAGIITHGSPCWHMTQGWTTGLFLAVVLRWVGFWFWFWTKSSHKMTRKINVQIICLKTLITVLQKLKNGTREDRAIANQFTVPDPGLIRAVTPNVTGNSSSSDCFRVMFT
jgi:hypothetical protein